MEEAGKRTGIYIKPNIGGMIDFVERAHAACFHG
jgi:hypothetical protein